MIQIKIYPSKHNIEIKPEAKFDTDLNIPLSYINIDLTKYDLNVNIEKDFLKNDTNKNIEKTPVLPNEMIEDTSRFYFNKYEEQVDISSMCKTIKGKKYFTPPYEFIPYNFSYELTVKKNMSYNSSTRYNINVACYDDADSMDLSTRLSSIFVHRDKEISNSEDWPWPSNITINNNAELSSNSLINLSLEQADFLFLETYDGQYLDAEKTEFANINNYLDQNVNVWVGCDTHHYYKYKNDDMGYITFTNTGAFKEFILKRPILSNDSLVQSDVYFNLNRPEYSQQADKKVHQLFTTNQLSTNKIIYDLSPVLVIEHVGKGFEIISHNDVLKNPVKYKRLITEVMMYVYMITYKKTKRIDEWITYNVPDYEVINNTLYTKTSFASKNLGEVLPGLSYNDCSIYQVNFFDNNGDELPTASGGSAENPYIDLVDVINNKLVFKMEKRNSTIYTEVEKPVGWVSIYQNGKIYYMNQIYYQIESNIKDKLFVIEDNNSLIVKLYPFKSSKHNINLPVDLVTVIKDIKTDNNGVMRVINEVYYLYLDMKDKTLHYEIKNYYEEQDTFIKLAEIDIRQSIDQTYLTDMRQLGGGLSEEAKNDYDLLDIGHVNGRPYRKSNTLIITMPKKYEQYKDKILAALDKYKVGEDYPVLFFEDEDK